MLRNNYIIFLLLLAITTIMVHSIIPHHHHSDHICLEFSFLSGHDLIANDRDIGGDCCDHTVAKKNAFHTAHDPSDVAQSCNQTSTHDPEAKDNKPNNCKLIEHLVYYPGSQQSEVFCPCSPVKQYHIQDVPPVTADINSGCIIFKYVLPFRQHPDLPIFAQEIACQCLGLRAPPSVM